MRNLKLLVIGILISLGLVKNSNFEVAKETETKTVGPKSANPCFGGGGGSY